MKNQEQPELPEEVSKPPSERVPYLELGNQSLTEINNRSETESTESQILPEEEEQHSPPSQTQPQNRMAQLRNAPLHTLAILTLALLVILVLLPRFILILSSILAEILLVVRFLLPLFLAIFIAVLLWQWYQQSYRR